MIAPVQSRDPFVSHVVTVSAYDTQHSEAARYCLKRNFGAKRGLTCARREDESVWPQVTIWSLQRVLRQYAVRFRNDDNFHLAQMKRRDHRSILTQVELEDLAATMRESALAGLPFSRSDRNSALCDILLWRQSKNSTGGRAYVKLSRYARHVLQTSTIDAALGGDGYLYDPHLLFAQDGITTDMLPEGVRKHQWLFISNNDCGVQTGTTFFERCTQGYHNLYRNSHGGTSKWHVSTSHLT
jgi:hypothetical protein